MPAGTTWPATAALPARPWKRSLLWLLVLGPFFFASYGFANHWAAHRQVTASLVYFWEADIPFVPWTIVPYWSIDLLYGLSFLLCVTPRQVDRHAARLLTAQIVSVTCFLLFPLRFAFERPEAAGLFGWLFDTLAGFDKPYNQAPSLHIGLLVIIWARFATLGGSWTRLAVHAWALLIGVSVLTTYQHHFIDVPTGALVGALCLWLWPMEGPPPLARWQTNRSSAARRLASRYMLAALLVAALALLFGGAALWLLWAAVALALVGLIYAGLGPAAFQKHAGRLSGGAQLLLAPYLAGAWLNSRLWTRRRPAPDPIADGVYLGRLPTAREMRKAGFAALFDLTAELPAPAGPWRYGAQPCLDLLPPAPEDLLAAARSIEHLRREGAKVLVCCALGYSRSACAVAAWLLVTGRVKEVDAAIRWLRECRPNIVLGAQHRAALAACRQLHDDGHHGH